MISSISYNQEEIIKNILQLHCKTPIQLDPTYSKGNFYKNITPPEYKFDITPVLPEVQQADATDLPLESNSIDTMIFDPPFLVGDGPSLKNDDDSNKMIKRFTSFSSVHKLCTFYSKALTEFHRILKDSGILIFKCQDTVSSGKQYITHQFIMNEANKQGFYIKDFFILLSKKRMISPKHTNQQHCRKFHSYFLVLEKSTKIPKFIDPPQKLKMYYSESVSFKSIEQFLTKNHPHLLEEFHDAGTYHYWTTTTITLKGQLKEVLEDYLVFDEELKVFVD